MVVEIDETGVRHPHAVGPINELEEAASVEKEEASYAGVAVEFADSLREHRAA